MRASCSHTSLPLSLFSNHKQHADIRRKATAQYRRKAAAKEYRMGKEAPRFRPAIRGDALSQCALIGKTQVVYICIYICIFILRILLSRMVAI